MTLLGFMAIAVPLSLLAGVMAFLITYSEYSRHFTDKRRAVRASLGTGAAAFAFFVAVTLAAGVALFHVLGVNP